MLSLLLAFGRDRGFLLDLQVAMKVLVNCITLTYAIFAVSNPAKPTAAKITSSCIYALRILRAGVNQVCAFVFV